MVFDIVKIYIIICNIIFYLYICSLFILIPQNGFVMIIATIKKVQELFPEWSNSTAQRKIQAVRDCLNKQKPKIISIDELKSFYLD